MHSWPGVSRNQKIGCTHGQHAVRRSHGLWQHSIFRRSIIYAKHAIVPCYGARWCEWLAFSAKLSEWKKREKIRVAGAMTLSFDDRKGYKLVRF